ncbi:MAG: MopE-related protein [Pseudomonadota bacterium]
MRPLAILVPLALLFGGCGNDIHPNFTDNDGDGFGAGDDCNDDDALIYPGAPEICDDIDNDCDDLVDMDDLDVTDVPIWYADADADGHGNPGFSMPACEQPTNYVAEGDDCDDGDPNSHPGAAEVCDEADNDCDGDVDEDVATTWYRDQDGDGFGTGAVSVAGCEMSEGYAERDDDCDDTDPDVNPDADELCNAVDDDCDGDTDEDDAIDAPTWYADADADGYGDAATTAVACAAPSGFLADDTDCDDTAGAVNPAATELCNAVDDDCSGTADEPYAADAPTWYYDRDADGYGDPAASTAACAAPTDYVADATDCDDRDDDVNPAATELCDGTDNDCDGTVDEPDAADAATWYQDRDLDGYGDPALATVACTAPSGAIADGRDCDDLASGINPAATEVCDGVDNDCDGTTDEDDAADAPTWYYDADGDGYGTSAFTSRACVIPAGFSESADDCEDTDPAVSPSASEVCGDGIDNDCDGGPSGCGIQGDVDLSIAASFLEAENASDRAGLGLATGDWDGDGLDDLLVGAYGHDAGGSDAGVAYLMLAPYAAGTTNLSTAHAILEGEAAGDNAGYNLTLADLAGDGSLDAVICAAGDDTIGPNSGAVYVLDAATAGTMSLGEASAKLIGETEGDHACRSVAAGDIDGDGDDDLLIGAYMEDSGGSQAGAVYVVADVPTGSTSLADAIAKLTGEGASAQAGISVASCDLDSDGIDDVIVGADGEDTFGSWAGAAYIEYGPISGTISLGSADARLYGEDATDSAGWALTSGDIDGDGAQDLVVGAYGEGSVYGYAGAVYIITQRATLRDITTLSSADAKLTGEHNSDRAGYVLAAGDVDGDGFDDIAASAPWVDTGGTSAGLVYLLSGPQSGTSTLAGASARLVGEDAYDIAGRAVALGDADGDGLLDIFVGAPGEGMGGSYGGETYLFYGMLGL